MKTSSSSGSGSGSGSGGSSGSDGALGWACVARRCRFYVLINAFISSVALGSYATASWVRTSSLEATAGSVVSLLAVYSVSLLRILAMVKWFEWIASKKQRINGGKRVALTPAQARSIYLRILWLVVPTECASFWFAQRSVRDGMEALETGLDLQSFLTTYAAFIPKSLVFELLFDLFHFSTHWLAHYNTWLYRNVHKRHHLHLHPSPLTTYEQDGFDLLLTNVLPFCLAWLLGFPFSELQLHLLFAYKTYVEVAGHCGLEIKGFSFPQMPLLQNLTHICLRVHDHDLHHTHPRWNFAKRFSLWDKLFRTFRPGQPLAPGA